MYPLEQLSSRFLAACGQPLTARSVRTIQANIGLKCNLACRHCHVESSPQRTESMSWPTMQAILDWARRLDIETLDVTGGAPEMHASFRRFVSEARKHGLHVIVRTNLTVMLLEEYRDLPRWLARQQVHLVASLPCYLATNVDRQRGRQVHSQSIAVLRQLNEVGYGRREDLRLDLIYNPLGTHLPPDQSALESAYRRELKRQFDIDFHRLATLANVPIGRFQRDLEHSGELEAYQSLLEASFNSATLPELMCRHQWHVGWDGTLYDCDFNFALGIPAAGAPSIHDVDPDDHLRRKIMTGDHCFACTAGDGSSCGGALVSGESLTRASPARPEAGGWRGESDNRKPMDSRGAQMLPSKTRTRALPAPLGMMTTKAAAAVRKTHLLIFTRYPFPGRTKTRLIPYLGDQGAALLQTRMTRHTLAVAASWRQTRPVAIEVWFADGDASLMQRALGDSFVYCPQQGTDLGSRLQNAFHHAFSTGAHSVLCIGSDCPELSPALLAEAAGALESHDVVAGPAVDGGYYLIGMRRWHPSLFERIEWGTDHVLQQTIDRVRTEGLSLLQLQSLTDVDTWQTLPAWHRRGHGEPSVCRRSVIIPTLNEESSIRQTLESVGTSCDTEIIVADGGSEDATREIASESGALVVPTPPGRGLQMTCGAALATGDVLLFLHGDTCLPPSWRNDLDDWWRSDSQAGAFSLRFDDSALTLRGIARAANWRSRWLQLPYGDQCLFMRRETFGELNGFRHLPIMEDVDLVRRWHRRGRWTIMPSHVTTSARKYRKHGIWRTVARHQWLLLTRWKLVESTGEPHAKGETECHAGQ